jgi:hypothetical protein
LRIRFPTFPTRVAVIDLQAALAAPRSGVHTVDPSFDLIGTGVARYVQAQ